MASTERPVATLEEVFGGIDIYLFDQLLRGRIHPSDRIVDVGCGWGRNLTYFLRSGYEVFGVDSDSDAIQDVRRQAAHLAPGLPSTNFHVESIEENSFGDHLGSVVISSAVLHFARDDRQFEAMLAGTWRLVAPGGLFFCRLASTIGMEDRIGLTAAGGRRYTLPDGTERYLVDEALLLAKTKHLGGQLLDPLKTTVVQDQRSMTTWVVRRGGR